MKILLVEDKVETSKMFQTMLEKAGFGVATAFDGLEAYQKMQAGGYSLILLDVKLPKMDGVAVLNALNENPPKVKNGPTVMLTVVGDESVVRKAVSLGAASYMDKAHLDPKQLVEKVEGMLGLVKRK